MKTILITNPDTNEKVLTTVDEGPIPYTVELSFGSNYSITMSLEDARELASYLAALGKEY